MKVVNEDKSFGVFPMVVKCQRVVDQYGFSYGKANDFCGSELEVEASDIVAHDWEKYPDYKGTDYGVKCPVCGQFVMIDKEKIPESIAKNAKKIRLN